MVVSARSGLGRLAVLAFVLAAVPVQAQERSSGEARREQWQRVDDIFAAMNVRPGAAVADVGAGDGFLTTRLAKAVGPEGRVYAVDVDRRALERLERRVEKDGHANVVIVHGETSDPKLPEGALDAILIVNAYHEMREHQAMLAAMRRALKPGGRLVIVEPITDARRSRSREDQVRSHEIAPEYVLQDARAAGFRIVGLQDPFATREHDTEWLLALQPAEAVTAPSDTRSLEEPPDPGVLDDPAIRIPLGEFRRLVSAGEVTIIDVRDQESFERGHIPGALSVPLDVVGEAAEDLRKAGKPVVSYCS